MVVPGRGGIIMTGQLGEVMRESAQAALTFTRARARSLGLPDSFYEQSDVHVHLPAGGIPKDGPSAGITMAIAMISALSGKPVRRDLAMTGEITLRGRILPVGGIKEKVLAAYRAGMRTVILPRRNLKDLDDVASTVREQIQFVPVEHVDEALALALCTGVASQVNTGTVGGRVLPPLHSSRAPLPVAEVPPLGQVALPRVRRAEVVAGS
jgi:ATP-dependent Lon protease